MKKFSVSKILCAAVFGVAASVSVMATADGYSETLVQTSAEGLRTTTVSYADLDLSAAEARETLHYRISNAARKVCGSTDIRKTASLRLAADNQSCYESAMMNAQRSLASEQVAAIAE